jgi:hypothetical protein
MLATMFDDQRAAGAILPLLQAADGHASKMFAEHLELSEVAPTELAPFAEQEAPTWREALECWDEAAFGYFEVGKLIDSIHVFAHYGIIRNPASVVGIVEASETIEAWIGSVERAIASIPPIWLEPDSTVHRTIECARGRLALDRGKSITVRQLAWLGRVGVKRIQNAMSAGTQDAPILDKLGNVTATSAIEWLKQSEEFQPSIWEQIATLDFSSGDWGRGVTIDPGPFAETLAEDDFVFVPVARDGSPFSPAWCNTNNGYTIGPKGNEVHIADYWDALAHLTRMDPAKWRRFRDPDQRQGSGLVSTHHWKRIPRRELQQEIEATI